MDIQALSPEAIKHQLDLSPSENDDTAAVLPIPSSSIDTTFAAYTNLTTTVLNAKVLSCSDEWFAEAVNLLNPGPVKGYPGVFISTGAKYDGWETRRHNAAPFDWMVIKLGCVATLHGVEIDTAFFTGNYGEHGSLDAFYSTDPSEDSHISSPDFPNWEVVLPPQQCGPSQRQAWKVSAAETQKAYTHLRLRMYPDGGFARLRVYGLVVPPPSPIAVTKTASSPSPSTSADNPLLEDLASALLGAVSPSSSDQHYGHRSNILLPGRGVDMGDGWETKRSRGKGHVDWVIVKLGLPAKEVRKVVVDTKDFKGNFPRELKVEGIVREVEVTAGDTTTEQTATETETETEMAHHPHDSDEDIKHDDPRWQDLVKGVQKGQPHTELIFEAGDIIPLPALVPALESAPVSAPERADTPAIGNVSTTTTRRIRAWTHVKLTMIPDGGVKRLRVWGIRA